MTYRINAQGRVMTYGLGMWTTLPPRKQESALRTIERRAILAAIFNRKSYDRQTLVNSVVSLLLATWLPIHFYV